MTRARRALIVAVLALAAGWTLPACRRAPAPDGASEADAPPPAQASAAPPAPRAERPRRDLAQDERHGGHTLARHVGKSDAELRDRLRREPRIPAASTYTDIETAEIVVAAAMDTASARIEQWADRQGRRPNLAIDYEGSPGAEIGRSLRRRARQAEPCHDAVVVLRWDERANGYYVLTSYPEVRR